VYILSILFCVIDPEVTSFLLTFYDFLRYVHVRNKPGFDPIVCGPIFIIDRHLRYFMLM